MMFLKTECDAGGKHEKGTLGVFFSSFFLLLKIRYQGVSQSFLIF